MYFITSEKRIIVFAWKIRPDYLFWIGNSIAQLKHTMNIVVVSAFVTNCYMDEK